MKDTFDEQDLVSLRRLDPTRHDVPPAPGSPRYERILEAAMTTTSEAPTAAQSPVNDLAAVRDRRARRGWAAGAAGLVAAAAAAVVAISGQGASEPPAPVALSAHSLVSKAVDATAGNTSMRATIRSGGGKVERISEAQADGGDMSVVTRTTGAAEGSDGSKGHLVVVGDTMWEWRDGEKPTGKKSDGGLVPFGAASKNVLDAALSGNTVNDTGTKETLRGVGATRYQITVTDTARKALTALKPEQLAWFELESPESVKAIDVWVGDDGLVHRIEVKNTDGVHHTSTEFHDFGADITITPPKGAGR